MLKLIKSIYILTILFSTLQIIYTCKSSEIMNGHTFAIDYEANTFLKDGQPFRYVSGSFHYFRTLPQKWRNVLRNMKAGGLNAVDIYIQWSLHNPKDNVYNWDGIANITDVIEAAIETELLVILRPGPYICAEIDNGGIPYWLFHKYPGIKLRTSDADYMNEVKVWYKKLMPQLEPYLYGNRNGDGIIMVQVENEYGAFKKCDTVYKNFLRDETLKYTKNKAILFTVDRPFDNELECGQIEGVFCTTDFGLSSDSEVEQNWKELRKVQAKGPLVNSEFYTGWLTHWQEPNQRRPGKPLAKTLEKILQDGANVNFYMYFGGTNYGFWAGSNDWGLGKYMADITSYDYDAPLDEAGNPTEKFEIFKKVIQAHLPHNTIVHPVVSPAKALNSVCLKPVSNLLSNSGQTLLGKKYGTFTKPPSFEQLDQNSGLLLYETNLPEFSRDPSELTVNGLHDRALIYIDRYFVGVLARENNIKSLPISAGFGQKLQILVENQGRINFQVADDYKGILGAVTLQTYDEPFYKELKNWNVTGFDFENYEPLKQLAFESSETVQINAKGILIDGPVLFSVKFNSDINADTYVDLTGWGKGVIYVNGWNLGRYWPLAGPQKTIYIPKELLLSRDNQLILIEYQKANSENYCVSFKTTPSLD